MENPAHPRFASALVDGRKDDSGKIRWRLLPWRGVRVVMDVVEHGARKYAPDNWRKVEGAEDRYSDALLRHVLDFASGEWLDPDSGLPHLAHAAWNCLVLLEFELGAQK